MSKPIYCPICNRPFRSLSKHQPACARRHAVAEQEAHPNDPRVLARAGAHARDDELLDGTGVTDVDIARLVHWIETGHPVVPSPSWRTWYSQGMSRMRPSLTRVVMEAVRLGIVRPTVVPAGAQLFRTQLETLPVHARGRFRPNRPACLQPAEGQPLRWRLLGRSQVRYVDCSACAELPLSCVADDQ